MAPSRFDDVPLPFSSNKPIPTRQPTMNRNQSLKRGKTLTRPERHVVPAPLIAPPTSDFAGGATGATKSGMDWWVLWSYATTFWAPPALLKLFGIKEKQSRQAWREKITLCWIAILLGAIVGFATMGLQRALCPGGDDSNSVYERLGDNRCEQLCRPVIDKGTDQSMLVTLSIEGWVFNVSTSLTQQDVDFYRISEQMPGQDITNLFVRERTRYPQCSSPARYASTPLCRSSADAGSATTQNGTLQACPLPTLSQQQNLDALRIQNTTKLEGYSWDQVARLRDYLVIEGFVLNMSPYIAANPKPIPGDDIDAAIRTVLSNQSTSGKDATRLFYNRKVAEDAVECLKTRYLAGRIDRTTPGCFVANLFLYSSLVVILGVVFARFAMACIFNWFLSAKLIRPPKDLARHAISPAVMPEGANVSVNNRTGTAPWAAADGRRKPTKLAKNGISSSSSTLVNGQPDPVISLQQIGSELFTVCLVTCYSEGEDSVRGTVESIAATNYSDSRKLLWIVCDGMITGQGEKMSTPDICVSMLDADPRFGNPMPMGYIAVGSGAKRENRAMVYAGHYGEYLLSFLRYPR